MSTPLLFQNPGLGSEVSNRFSEGGTFFMTLILICLLTASYFLVKGFLSRNKDMNISKRMIRLASDVSILGLVIGLLGSIIGMIVNFDMFGAGGSIDTGMLANGIKMSFLTTVFGSITFILPRIGIIVLKAMHTS